MSQIEYIGKITEGKQEGCWLACVFDLKPDERFDAFVDLDEAKKYVESFSFGEFTDLEWFEAKKFQSDVPHLFLLSGTRIPDEQPTKAAVS